MAIPKQAFKTWLAARVSLKTGERLVNWGYGGTIVFPM
jgi:hypothetical protein